MPVVKIGDPRRGSPNENPTLFRWEPPVPRDRVIIIDETDNHLPLPDVRDGDYLAYFKRSWIDKTTGRATMERQNYFPTPYAIADEYLNNEIPVASHRPIDILCTLRGSRAKNGPRDRVSTWVKEAFLGSSSLDVQVGQFNTANKGTIDSAYFTTMRRTKIVVTSNPNDWEGDFRLFEAMSSGALVFVDAIATPYHHPLIHGQHLVYYDNRNQSDLISKLHHAIRHPRWARRVAINGYRHVLRHHRAVSWVDYFLRTALALLDNSSSYVETGIDLLERTSASANVVREPSHGGLTLESSSLSLSDDDGGHIPSRRRTRGRRRRRR